MSTTVPPLPAAMRLTPARRAPKRSELCARCSERTTSLAVTAEPSLNVTPPRRVMVQVVPLTVQDSASIGCGVKPVSRAYSPS